MTLTITDGTRSTSWNVSISFHLIPFDYGKGFASLLSLLDLFLLLIITQHFYLTFGQLQSFFLPMFEHLRKKKDQLKDAFPY